MFRIANTPVVRNTQNTWGLKIKIKKRKFSVVNK